MTGRGLGRAVLSRCRLTGESFQQAAAELLRSGARRSVIPAAEGDQRLFEHILFRRLTAHANYYGYVGMIRSASPRTSGLRLALGGEQLALAFLNQVLPLADPSQYSEIGVPSLRVTAIRTDGLHLGMHGTTASVVVGGVRRCVWRAALAQVKRESKANGLIDCWHSTGGPLHDQEDRHLSYFRSWLRDDPNKGWLASGLLRRIGVLNAANAFCVNAWSYPASQPRGEQWVIDLLFAPTVRRDQNVIDLVSSHTCGLNLTLTRAESWTNEPDTEPVRYADFHSGHQQSPVRLQLRFSTWRPDNTWEARQLMADDGLESTRLDSIVPPATAPSTPPPHAISCSLHRCTVPRIVDETTATGAERKTRRIDR